jgi:hypothetical protein
MNRTDWRERAACLSFKNIDWVETTDPELGKVCGFCPVQRECATFVLKMEDQRERPSGWYAGHFMPPNETSASGRRVALDRLREIASCITLTDFGSD